MSIPGLVADYGSESDESANDETSHDIAAIRGKPAKELPTRTEGRNLLEAGDSSSEDEETPVNGHEETETVQGRLPNPLLDGPRLESTLGHVGAQTEHTGAQFSVFTNQYREAEKAKHSILEKHVKMTESGGDEKKKICWKFKKGRCRFGKSCKYSHDLDTVSSTDTAADSQGPSTVDTNQMFRSRASLAYANQNNWQNMSLEDDKDDDSYMANVKRKRRAGVNDTLRPSKKALVPLEYQRATERPWTSQHQI